MEKLNDFFGWVAFIGVMAFIWDIWGFWVFLIVVIVLGIIGFAYINWKMPN